MATTPFKLFHDPDKTLKATFFPDNNDTAAWSNQNLTQSSNTKGEYNLDITEALDGIHKVLVTEDSEPVALWEVDLQDTTDICVAKEVNTALTDLQNAYPNKAIYFDGANGNSGTRRGVNGTRENPVDNWSGVITLAESLGFKHIIILDWNTTFTLTKNMNDYVIESEAGLKTLPQTFFDGFNVENGILKI